MNQVILIGNLTNDVTLRYSQSGKEYAFVNVCCSEKWRNAAGEERENKTFLDVVCYGAVAESAASLSKGERVIVVGRCNKFSREVDGARVYEMNIVAAYIAGHAPKAVPASNFDNFEDASVGATNDADALPF